MAGETFTGADILRDLAIERRPVFWDDNAGGWCWRVPGRSPVQADSWAAAWAAVDAARKPAPAIHGPITRGDDRVPVVRWWHRLFLS